MVAKESRFAFGRVGPLSVSEVESRCKTLAYLLQKLKALTEDTF